MVDIGDDAAIRPPENCGLRIRVDGDHESGVFNAGQVLSGTGYTSTQIRIPMKTQGMTQSSIPRRNASPHDKLRPGTEC